MRSTCASVNLRGSSPTDLGVPLDIGDQPSERALISSERFFDQAHRKVSFRAGA
jgi:hypothetical protein